MLGFRFNESTQQISNTLGEHAWYENRASSLHVDRSTRTDPRRAGFDADDVTNYNDKCWFRVSESELKHVFSIPASDSNRALVWYEWASPARRVCSHCLIAHNMTKG